MLPNRDLVLIGAGHTNLYVVRMWRMQPIPDVRLTVVSPFSRATYSGMLPGTLAGLYRPEEMEIDLYRFAESCGARLIVDAAIGLDPDIRRILFADRPPLRYDVASIGIGSIPGQRTIWENHPRVLSIKPMATFRQRFETLVSAVRGSAPAITVAVVGAGAGGTEIAFGSDALLRNLQISPSISLVDSNPEILSGYAAGTIRRVRREFDRRGIAVHLGQRVVAVEDAKDGESTTWAAGRLADRNGNRCAPECPPARLRFESGSTLSADIILWTTAAAAPPVLEGFRLPKSADGFLAVDSTLKTIADYPVFAVGDTASIVTERLPRAGVYAVREGPVLWGNLQRLFAGRELAPYVPQQGFLSLLSTGDGRAVMEYKGISGHGRYAWKWKDYIDRKFMRMYQDYSRRPMPPPPPTGPAQLRLAPRPSPLAPGPMRCFGCGGKVGADVLTSALQRLNLPVDGRVKLGLDHPDDATILDRQAAPIDVLSVDFFPAFLDDPYLVGRVAALNSLSDLWAMGSDPVGAMAIVTLPSGSPTQQTELLYQLLSGGLRELTAAGASLWGGHTTEGPELTIGYTVAGRLDNRPPLTKGNLRPGDRLILTKALGTGTLLAAHRDCQCPATAMDHLVTSMLRNNREPARLARQFEVLAATDVTGFGLAGHLLEMLSASQVSARIALSSLPLLPGFAELSLTGIRSSLDPANRVAENRMHYDEAEVPSQAAYHALFDPQTAGGLLLGVAPHRCNELLAALHEHGCPAAAIVGDVFAADGEIVLNVGLTAR